MRETIRAAFVIARRDFTAIIFSKSFIIFLAGPLFPLIIAVLAGGLGKQVNQDIDRPIIGIALNANESAAILAAREKLVTNLGENGVPELIVLNGVDPDDPNIAEQLDQAVRPLTAIFSGSLEKPRLTGSERDIRRWQGRMALLSETALSSPQPVEIEAQPVASTGSATQRNRLAVAQGGQVILILLTMILAGMVLSNLVEEKANKILEILAAAIPMDAIFLGKLFAMLGMAIVGIAVWTTMGFVGLAFVTSGLPNLPAPAVGWPLFGLLMILYFSMAYLLLGSLFLGIGAQAATVREVQTLNMPVTMGQLLVFFLAAFSVTKLGEPVEWAAVLIPFSSPFAMIARAAQMDNIWQHGLALMWQAMFTLIIIRFSVVLFRRNVMKSGNSSGKKGFLASLRG